MSISILYTAVDLKLGSLYLWSPAPKDVRTWVAFFHVSDLSRSVNRPKENTVIMYLGREYTGNLDAYMLLIGDQKYAVYNDDFRYGLKEV
jgi:hypothetical protein